MSAASGLRSVPAGISNRNVVEYGPAFQPLPTILSIEDVQTVTRATLQPVTLEFVELTLAPFTHVWRRLTLTSRLICVHISGPSVVPRVNQQAAMLWSALATLTQLQKLSMSDHVLGHFSYGRGPSSEDPLQLMRAVISNLTHLTHLDLCRARSHRFSNSAWNKAELLHAAWPEAIVTIRLCEHDQ